MAKLYFGFPDIHFPNNDPVAYSVAMKAHKILSPDVTICGNDLFDNTPFSRWGVKTFREEEFVSHDWKKNALDPAMRHLDTVQKHTKKTMFLEGNHDAWLERWAISLGHLGHAIYPMLSIKNHVLNGRDIDYYSEGEYITLNENLIVVHGWSIAKHAASIHLQKSRPTSVIFHHTHRQQLDTNRNYLNDRQVQAMSPGCLCKFQPVWRNGDPTSWTHGFWIAYVGKESYTAYMVAISDGRCILPDGTEVRVR